MALTIQNVILIWNRYDDDGETPGNGYPIRNMIRKEDTT